MLAPDWTWWSTVPVILAAIVLLWVPGALLAAGLGASRWPTVAVAPVLTTSLVSVGGIVCGLVGIPWGLGPLFVVALVVPLLVVLLRALVRRRHWPVPGLEAPPVPVREVVVGALVAAVVALVVLLRAIPTPGDIPQQPDIVFHLGTVRYLLESGSISSLTANGLNDAIAPGFYPAAFHGLAASLMLLTGAPVVIAEQALLLVATTLVWPLGVMFLVGATVGSRHHLVLLTGFVAGTLPGFPFLLLVWGGVWPSAFAFTLLPAVVGLVGLGLAGVFAGRAWVSAALLAALAVPGLSLAHTSATFAAVAAGIALAAAECWTWARTGRHRGAVRWLPLALLVLGSVTLVLVLAGVAPTGMKETGYDRTFLAKAVIGATTLWAPTRDNLLQLSGGLLLALALVGVTTAVRDRGRRWIVATWLVFWVLGFLTSYLPSDATWVLTWPWYNLPVRLQAVAAVFAVPVIAMGVATLLAWAGRGGAMLRDLALAAVAVVVGLQVLSATAGIEKVYGFSGVVAWMDDEKADALRELSGELPDDAVVVSNPWRGGSYLYTIGPEDTAFHTEKAWSPDLEVVAGALDRVLVDPTVCAAVEREGIDYVITGGSAHYTGDAQQARYVGIDDVSPGEGFVVVERSDPYTLWEVPDCVG